MHSLLCCAQEAPRGAGVAGLRAELAAIQADHARLRTAMVQNL